MEILTYVLEGTLEHTDTMGNRSEIRAGEFQLMSAGTGVRHTEANASPNDPLHLLQIWILPDAENYEPRYSQCQLGQGQHTLGLREDQATSSDRHVYIQVLHGELALANLCLQAGDGVAIHRENELLISAISTAEFLLFNLS